MTLDSLSLVRYGLSANAPHAVSLRLVTSKRSNLFVHARTLRRSNRDFYAPPFIAAAARNARIPELNGRGGPSRRRQLLEMRGARKRGLRRRGSCKVLRCARHSALGRRLSSSSTTHRVTQTAAAANTRPPTDRATAVNDRS